MPLTALTTLFGSLALLGSWLLIGSRMRKAQHAVSRQVVLLHRYFLCMGLFFLIMFLPHLWLGINPSQFPLLMMLGYTVGHVFLYMGLTYTGRLLFSMSPRLASKESWAAAFGALATLGITLASIVTLPFGELPVYDFQNNVTLFSTAPVVGIAIGLFSILTVLPAAVLMFVNGVRNPDARIRSFLLGAGLFILMGGGPLHDAARTSTVFMVADGLTMLGLLLITVGVLYRFEERFVAGPPEPEAAISRQSNVPPAP